MTWTDGAQLTSGPLELSSVLWLYRDSVLRVPTNQHNLNRDRPRRSPDIVIGSEDPALNAKLSASDETLIIHVPRMLLDSKRDSRTGCSACNPPYRGMSACSMS